MELLKLPRSEELCYSARAGIVKGTGNLKILREETSDQIITEFSCDVKSLTLSLVRLNRRTKWSPEAERPLEIWERDEIKKTSKSWIVREGFVHFEKVTKEGKIETAKTDARQYGIGTAPLFDFLNVLFLFRGKALALNQKLLVAIFNKKGPIEAEISFVEESMRQVDALSHQSRPHLRARIQITGLSSNHFLIQPTTQIWIDRETGILTSGQLSVLGFSLVRIQLEKITY